MSRARTKGIDTTRGHITGEAKAPVIEDLLLAEATAIVSCHDPIAAIVMGFR